MLTHYIQPAAKSGFMQVTDARTGRVQLVFVGETAASQLHSAAEIRPLPEAPSQKWISVIAA